MAETRRTKRRNAGNSAVLGPPSKTATPPPSSQPEPEPPPRQHISKFKTFAQAMAAIAPADWGKRAKITLYRLEPVIDQLRTNSVKYIEIYPHPVDEDRIKRDYGSGRYRLMLTFKKPGGALSDELDSVEFDILDMNFPPKIPEGAWVDDHRNTQKWGWAKKFFKSEEAAAPKQPDILEQLNVLDQIQDRAADRLRANAPPPAPPPDPNASPLSLAKEIIGITQGGGQAAMMQMFGDQLKRAQDRADKLEDELRASMKPQAPPAPVDPIDYLATNLDKFKKIREVIAPEDKDGLISDRLKSRMSGWQEFGVTMAEKFFTSPWAGQVFGMFAQAAYAKSANGTAPPSPAMNGHSNGAAPLMPNGAGAPNQMQQLSDFVNYFAAPMLNQFGDEMTGAEFASWIWEGHGEEWIHPSGAAVPWLTAARRIGSGNLLRFYQQSPYWSKIQPQAARFEIFLQEFCAWSPEADEPESDEPEEIKFDEATA